MNLYKTLGKQNMVEPRAGGSKKWEQERSKRHIRHKILKNKGKVEENKFTGYMKKEEIRRQKTFGLKKAVDVSVYREDGLKDTQNTRYKQECS